MEWRGSEEEGKGLKKLRKRNSPNCKGENRELETRRDHRNRKRERKSWERKSLISNEKEGTKKFTNLGKKSAIQLLERFGGG